MRPAPAIVCNRIWVQGGQVCGVSVYVIGSGQNKTARYRRVGTGRGSPGNMSVLGHLSGSHSMAILPRFLPQIVAGTLMDRHAAPQVGKGKSGAAISPVCGTQKRKERLILRRLQTWNDSTKQKNLQRSRERKPHARPRPRKLSTRNRQTLKQSLTLTHTKTLM